MLRHKWNLVIAAAAAVLAAVVGLAGQSITIPNTFTNGTIADATQVNANFSALSSNALNRNGGTMLGTLNSRALTPTSDATYDAGTNVLRYRDGWFSRNGSFAGTLTVAGTTTFNSLAYTWPAAQTANYFLQTNGSGTLSWGQPTTSVVDEFRLTLTTGLSVTTADVTGASAGTLYLSPHGGRRMTVFDGSGNAVTLTSPEISIAVPASTSQLYDAFAYNNSGALALELLAWTNDTTRATAVVKTGAADAAGVWTKSGDPTRRLVGCMRTTTVAGQTEDSVTKAFVVNVLNSKPRLLSKADSTASWAYVTTATVRQARATATNEVEFIQCVPESPVTASYFDIAQTNDASLRGIKIGLGLDSTTAFTATQSGNTLVASSALQTGTTAQFQASPAAGYHFLAMLEAGDAAVTVTFYGTGTYTGAATLHAQSLH